MRFKYRLNFYTFFKVCIVLGVLFVIIAVQNDIVLRIGAKIGIMVVFTLYLFIHKNRIMPQTVYLVKQNVLSRINGTNSLWGSKGGEYNE